MEPSDLFQFCYDTTPILGTLQDLINNKHKEAVQRAIRIVPVMSTTCAPTIWFTREARIS